jgi:hypothetical protein
MRVDNMAVTGNVCEPIPTQRLAAAGAHEGFARHAARRDNRPPRLPSPCRRRRCGRPRPALALRPGRQCLPRHIMPFIYTQRGFKMRIDRR